MPTKTNPTDAMEKGEKSAEENVMTDDMWRKNHKFPNLLYFVDDIRFEMSMGLIIICNCVTIGVQTNNLDTQFSFIVLAEQLFTLVFVAELGLRCTVYGWRQSIIGDIYTFFDFLLVMITGVLLTWILQPLGLVSGFFRNFQVLRALRLARVVRVVRFIPLFVTVWQLFKSIMDTVMTLFWSGLLVLFMLFVFGVFGVEMIGRNNTWEINGNLRDQWFGSVTSSMFTLLQIMLVDDAFVIITEVERRQPGMWIFFIIYLAISNLCVLNLITGVVLQVSLSIANSDPEALLEKTKKKNLELRLTLRHHFSVHISSQPDLDFLTRENFHYALEQPDVFESLTRHEIPYDSLNDIFEFLIHEQSKFDDKVPYSLFIDYLMRIRGDANAKETYQLQFTVYELEQTAKCIDQQLVIVDENMGELDCLVKNLLNATSKFAMMVSIKIPDGSILKKEKVDGEKQKPKTKRSASELDMEPTIDNSLIPREDPPIVSGLTPRGHHNASEHLHRLPVGSLGSTQVIDILALNTVKYFLLLKGFILMCQKSNEEFNMITSQTFVYVTESLFEESYALELFKEMDINNDLKLSHIEICHCMACDHVVGGNVVVFKQLLFEYAWELLSSDPGKEVDSEDFSNLMADFYEIPYHLAESVFLHLDLKRKGNLTFHEIGLSLSLDSSLKAMLLTPTVTKMKLLLDYFKSVAPNSDTLGFTRKEFLGILTKLGLTEDECKAVLQTPALKDHEFISMSEFVNIIGLSREKEYSVVTETILEYYMDATKKKHGTEVAIEQFIDLMGRLGLSEEVSEMLFCHFDVDHNGLLSLEEFKDGLVGYLVSARKTQFLFVKYVVLVHAFSMQKQNGSDPRTGITPYDFANFLKKFDIDRGAALSLFSLIDEKQTGKLSIYDICRIFTLTEKGTDVFEQTRYALIRSVFPPKQTAKQYFDKTGWLELADEMKLCRATAEEVFNFRDFDQDGLFTLHELISSFCTTDPIMLKKTKSPSYFDCTFILLQLAYDNLEPQFTSDMIPSSDFVIKLVQGLNVRKKDAEEIANNLWKFKNISQMKFLHSLSFGGLPFRNSSYFEQLAQQIKRNLLLHIVGMVEIDPKREVSRQEFCDILVRAGCQKADAGAVFDGKNPFNSTTLNFQETMSNLTINTLN